MKNKYRTQEEIKRDVARLPRETRQKVIDLFRTGMTVGKICEELGLDLMDTAEIISQNISCYHYLEKEVK